MKSAASGEKGFTLVQVIVSLAITVLVVLPASGAMFQILKNSGRTGDYLTAVHQVQNAGDWISRDTQMALGVSANLTLPVPVLLTLTWTEDAFGTPVYHTDNYTIENLNGGIGTIRRRHTSTAGANEQALIARYVYYNPADAGNTTMTSYQNPLLTIRLASHVGASQETREYKIIRRPNALF